MGAWRKKWWLDMDRLALYKEAYDLAQAGMTYTDIGVRQGVKYPTISRRVKAYEDHFVKNRNV